MLSEFTLSSSRFSLRHFEAHKISSVLGAILPKDFPAALVESSLRRFLYPLEQEFIIQLRACLDATPISD